MQAINLMELLQLLVNEGPKSGYCPETDERYLIVAPKLMEKIFSNFKSMQLPDIACLEVKLAQALIQQHWISSGQS